MDLKNRGIQTMEKLLKEQVATLQYIKKLHDTAKGTGNEAILARNLLNELTLQTQGVQMKKAN